MRRNIIVVIFITITMFLLTGCWDKKELTDIAIVAAMGIDRAEDGKIKGTFQIINPLNTAGGLQGGATGEGTPVTVYTSIGENISDMTGAAATKVSRKLYYGHTNVIVIGAEFAKEEGILEILDFLDRDIEFRTTANVVIAKDNTASDLLQVLTPIDKIPANKIIKTLQYGHEKWGEITPTNVQEIITNIVSTGQAPIIPVFEIHGNIEKGKNLENNQATEPDARVFGEGYGILKDGKIIDWLNDNAARGTVFLLDEMKETYISADWKDKKDVISFKVKKSETKVKVDTKQEIPTVYVEINAKGSIGEVDVPIDITSQKVLKELEKNIESEIKKIVQVAVARGQENKLDIFGFGSKIHQTQPKVWDMLKDEWDEGYFPKLQVNIDVNAAILRTGLRNKPYLYQMENISD